MGPTSGRHRCHSLYRIVKLRPPSLEAGIAPSTAAKAGVSLPHSSSAQSQMGIPVGRDELQPGDLIFYYSRVSHVAIYVGDGQIIHAYSPSAPVSVDLVGPVGAYNSPEAALADALRPSTARQASTLVGDVTERFFERCDLAEPGLLSCLVEAAAGAVFEFDESG